ncbi:hypothetical protein FN846DRAFT_38503 [Sphaerosporella brunnea]|uniref:Uncharacterized protein n=1 Tax=Sphaerosporella brunnea TaxID=1250544 RepID=A0A5J5F9Q4_9PEZI|nr:hypothetical protein FN846DRAFT_38503 [Sphaerosporella brunnea]
MTAVNLIPECSRFRFFFFFFFCWPICRGKWGFVISRNDLKVDLIVEHFPHSRGARKAHERVEVAVVVAIFSINQRIDGIHGGQRLFVYGCGEEGLLLKDFPHGLRRV